jgi:transposase
VGRPTKYKPEYCEQLIEAGRNGWTFQAFAGKIGVDIDTLHEWCKAHPDFSEAKKKAKTAQGAWLEGMGRAMMAGKIPGAVPSVWIFYMKNCQNWRDQPAIEQQEIEEIEFIE